jgi:hypothetical protein
MNTSTVGNSYFWIKFADTSKPPAMKKVLFFGILAAFMLIGGRGFSQGNSLTIIADNGEKFTLEVNGDMESSTADDRVTVYNLFGPSFKVKVFIEGAQVAPVAKTVFNKPNTDFYFVLHKNAKGIYVLDPVSSDYTPAATAAATPPPAKETQTKSTAATETKPATSKSGCSEPLTTEEFAVLYAQVSARPFAGTQVSAVKNLVVDKCVTSGQLQELLYILDMESSRLDVAKYSYLHVYDPDNYGVIDEVFRIVRGIPSQVR